MPSHTRYPDDTDEIPVVDASGSPVRPATDAEATASTRPDRSAPDASAEPFKIDLSLSQILGGGLAAATAAAVGSKLGVGGTIGGAAVASVIAAVAGSVYTASVRRTKAGMRNVFRKRTTTADSAPVLRQGTADWATTSATDTLPASPAVDPTSSFGSVPHPTASRVTGATSSVTGGSADGATEQWLTTDTHTNLPSAIPPADAAPRTGRRWPKLAWKRVLVGALAVFVLASVAIFGIERVTGQSLDGEKGTTTFGQVAEPNSGRQQAPSAPTSGEASSEASNEPSSEPSSQASDEPSSQASDEASAGASSDPSGAASSDPSSQPSSSGGAASSQPSASSNPSTGTSSAPSAAASGAGENSQGG